jgi:uncharacterized protein (DUF1330 family)
MSTMDSAHAEAGQRTAASENATLTDDTPVYFVIHQHITDEPRFDAYVAAVTPLIAARGATLVAAGTPETIEGESRFERTVVFLWPSRRIFHAFWHSPEYAEIHTLRAGAAEWHAQLVPALPDAAAHADIAAVLEQYAEGARTGSAELILSAFHPEASIRGSFRGAPVDRSLADFAAFVARSGPAAGLRCEPPTIDAIGDVATARLECRDWHGVRYTDLFTLIRRNGSWRIVSKVFDAHADA